MENRIGEYRKKKGYTQDFIAKKAGVTREHICNIENGKTIGSFKVISSIAKTLEVKMEDIFLG